MATTDTVNKAIERLTHASEDVKAARAKLREEQEAAWKRYVAVVDEALKKDLGPGIAEAQRSMSIDAHELLDATRGRLEDLRVRAHLGVMELSDLADELQQSVDRVTERIRR